MRSVIGIIGSGSDFLNDNIKEFAFELGDRLVFEGYRIVSGGKAGIMEAVCRGAMNSDNYFEGSIIGILPESDKKYANNYCDLIIPTGFGINRNTIIINTADVLIAIKGDAGTLSEIAFAWQYSKKVLCVTGFGGWSEKLAAQNIDSKNKDLLIPVSDIDEIIEEIKNFLS